MSHQHTCRSPTRERLKLIARVGNVEEWSKAGPLSGAEQRLISKYNDKPLLTRPQHSYFAGDVSPTWPLCCPL